MFMLDLDEILSEFRELQHFQKNNDNGDFHNNKFVAKSCLYFLKFPKANRLSMSIQYSLNIQYIN